MMYAVFQQAILTMNSILCLTIFLLFLKTILILLYQKIRNNKTPTFISAFYILFVFVFGICNILHLIYSQYINNMFLFGVLWNINLIFYSRNLLTILAFLCLQIYIYEITALKTPTSILPKNISIETINTKLKKLQNYAYFFALYEIFVQSLLSSLGSFFTINNIFLSDVLTILCLFSASVCIHQLLIHALVRKKTIRYWLRFNIITTLSVTLSSIYNQVFSVAIETKPLVVASIVSSFILLRVFQIAFLVFELCTNGTIVILYDADMENAARA